MPENAPYTSHHRAYHYPNPIRHLPRVLGDTDSGPHIQGLKEKLTVPLYHSALRPACIPAHLQKRRIKLLREQIPLLTRVARWLARKHIHVAEEQIRCPCDHTTPEELEHFRICPLQMGRDTLVGWSPAETLQQHEGWRAHSKAHQATEHLFSDSLLREATMTGEVTQALHRHLTKYAENPMGAAAHLQLEAVRRAAAKMVHSKHLLLTHTEQLTDPTARENMLRLIITMPCMTQKSTNLLCTPHTPPVSVCRPPGHHRSTPEDHPPQDPPATSTHDTPRPTSHPRDQPAPPCPTKPAQDHQYIDVDAEDRNSPARPRPPDPEHPFLTPTTIRDRDLLRAAHQGRALDTPLGWYCLQERWIGLTVKALQDLAIPGKGLHEAIVDLVLWRARQHAQGQHVWIPQIEWGGALTHDSDTNVTR